MLESKKVEKIKYINGNKQTSYNELPKIIIKSGYVNEVWFDNVYKTSGLKFKKHYLGFESQPVKAKQITQFLIACGGSKIRYYDNWNYDNALIVKFDHHIGFDVDSICLDCVKHNDIRVNDLKEGDRLSC